MDVGGGILFTIVLVGTEYIHADEVLALAVLAAAPVEGNKFSSSGKGKYSPQLPSFVALLDVRVDGVSHTSLFTVSISISSSSDRIGTGAAVGTGTSVPTAAALGVVFRPVSSSVSSSLDNKSISTGAPVFDTGGPIGASVVVAVLQQSS